jgi:secondary thiamine-phosphate synthase enzyme
MILKQRLTLPTRGRGTYDMTAQVEGVAGRAGIAIGFCHHTSASLIWCENADPTARRDLDGFLGRLVPDGDHLFDHIDEGPDNMPAHVRAILTKMGFAQPRPRRRASTGWA